MPPPQLQPLKPISTQNSSVKASISFWLALIFAIFMIQLPALSAPLLFLGPQDDPLSGLRSNVGVDIISHKGAVWIGTSKGASYTLDNGVTWFTFDATNGLATGNIGAMYSSGDTIWVAEATSIDIDGQDFLAGAGVRFSSDQGITWEIPEDTSGILAESVFGGGRLVFDLTGDGKNIFAASFAGGLLGSDDGGITWKRFHASFGDSIWHEDLSGAPPLTTRYFSAVADTAHGDSTILWAGSAGGIARFVFAPKAEKASSRRVTDYAYSPADHFLYIAGETGLSRCNFLLYNNWKSVFDTDGLPSNVVGQIHFFGGKLLAGLLDSVGGDGVGIVITNADLGSITNITDPTIAAVSNTIGAAVYDFGGFNDQYLYVAGGTAGLYFSSDTGLSWAKITVDSNSILRNNVYAVTPDSLGDLWVGTDSGLTKLFVDDSGLNVDSSYHLVMADSPQVAGVGGSGASVREIAIQEFRESGGALDSVALWTANHPISASGEFSTHRIILDGTGAPVNDTTLFRTSRVDAFEFYPNRTRVFFLGPDGMRSITSSEQQGNSVELYSSLRDSTRVPLDAISSSIDYTAMLVVGDTFHVGTEDGFAVTTNSSFSQNRWHIVQANIQSFAHDSVSRYHQAGPQTLAGDFVTALGVQYRGIDTLPMIWAATNGVGFSLKGFSRFDQSTIPSDSAKWEYIDSIPDATRNFPDSAWNFGFNGDTVFVATSDGLYFSTSSTGTFAPIDIFSNDPEIRIPLGATVNGVAVIDTTLWVVSDEGTASRPVDMGGIFDIHRAIDSTALVYAFPIPFSPESSAGDGLLKFHYRVPSNANSVSITIYDFSMNLVAEVTRNAARFPGSLASGFESDKWNGRNGKGEIVAPDMYYFKVKFSNGDVRWGKIAVIP